MSMITTINKQFQITIPREVFKKMSADEKKNTLIYSLNEIPSTFASEDDERDWWATHEFSEELYEKLRDYSDYHRLLLKNLKDKKRVETLESIVNATFGL